MKKTIFRPFAAALLLATPFFFTSCKDDNDDPEPEDENELITTVEYTLTPIGGGQAVTATWRDIDGQGGNAPTISTLTLAPNKRYTGSIRFLDETKTPVENTTDEVREESYEHLVVYTLNPTSLMTITRTDKDRNNLEVGLSTTVQTGAAASGSLRIQLRHQPGAKDGTEAPGSDDANVTFPVVLQ